MNNDDGFESELLQILGGSTGALSRSSTRCQYVLLWKHSCFCLTDVFFPTGLTLSSDPGVAIAFSVILKVS